MLTERQLQMVEKAVNGDRAVLEQLVSQFQQMVISVAMKVLGNFYDAEDVAQETWMNVERKIHQVRNPKLFLGWLRQIAWHKARRALDKKMGRMTCLDSDIATASAAEWNYDWLGNISAADQSPSGIAADSEQAEQLRQCLDRLGARDHDLLVEHYWNGLSAKQISERDHLPVGTVKRQLHDARAHLKTLLKAA